ncbi:multiple inositol polyphosphate phosphatase 1-like [Achroia grisella]|uniref:multiple inositol polyphosphate phosphatase 1-like n=1 Tax=Achroia grisella TaxID=688607 RepID=UPI0027D2C358|nr:multiple inositol polyphosphate phosphatase 1-like [Achroia grisella]
MQFHGAGVTRMTLRLFVLHMLIFVVYGRECHWNTCPYVYFGGKTLYDDVRGDIRDVADIKGCVPSSVWLLGRHGTRNPSSFDIDQMMETAKLKDEIVKNHAEGRGQMCAEDISNLKNWKWNGTINEPHNLNYRGYIELKQLGSRIREKFTQLLEHVKQYQIRPTNERRTIDSAKAFVDGLKRNLSFNVTTPLEKDVILMPYKYCPKHIQEVWEGNRTQAEMNQYYESNEFKKMQTDMKARADLTELSATNIIGIYDLCRYYRAYSDSKKSAWCALFTNQDLALVEYSKDLQHYYRNGYGNLINAKLGELVLKDLYDSFQNALKTNDTSFTAYFSHDSLMDMVYSALGLFQDYPQLTGFKRILDRKWRTSLHTPFAANFMAILHRCNPDLEATVDSTYRVQFLINEIEIQLCESQMCSWREFEDKFKPFLDSSLDFCGVV